MHCDGTSITLVGRSAAMHVAYHEVSPKYFATLETPIIRGREFDATDAVGTEPVMVINRSAARRIWGSDDPFTTPVIYGDKSRRVIGIVEDARYEDVEREPSRRFSFRRFRPSQSRCVVCADERAWPSSPADISGVRRGRGHAMGTSARSRTGCAMQWRAAD
jgi:hypothetical protein